LAIVAGMIKLNDHTEPTKVNYIVNYIVCKYYGFVRCTLGQVSQSC